MPVAHKWKCLNTRCKIFRTEIFVAMNSPMPECPQCRSVKLEDWGVNASFGIGGSGRRMDATLRKLADAHGMTDINNKDGRPAKGYQADTAPGKYGTKTIAGVEVPINDRPTGAWGKSAYTAFKAPSGARMPNRKSIPTEVVASYKGGK